MNCRKIRARAAATALALTLPLMLAAPAWPEDPELVHSPPTAPVQSSLALPVGAESLMMRLAQSPATQYVHLYNEAAIGSCIVWLQAS